VSFLLIVVVVVLQFSEVILQQVYFLLKPIKHQRVALPLLKASHLVLQHVLELTYLL
jgi:hypothetical protein